MDQLAYNFLIDLNLYHCTAKDKESNKLRMAKKRKEMTEDQKEKQRQADREGKARRRAEKK